MIVNKAHPVSLTLINPGNSTTVVGFHDPRYGDKCNSIKGFERFLIIVRNPYESIWAEYQRQKSKERYLGGILHRHFDSKQWEEYALKNTYGSLPEAWSLYNQIENVFPLNQNGHVFIRYEDLKDPITRYETLKRLLSFVKVPLNEKRLKCAFLLADNPHTHRQVNTSSMVSIGEAYASHNLVCDMWRGMSANTKFRRFGYSIWRNITCSNLSAKHGQKTTNVKE